jgi:hypothetical protein
MTLAKPGPGRPRPATTLHMVVTRELTACMRQLRIAAGESTEDTVTVLNKASERRYPDAAEPGRWSRRGVPVPRLVTEKYLSQLERGYHSRPGSPPAWLANAGYRGDPAAQGSRVPAWLVRAYDLAFGADGFLVDVYRWARSLLADHQHNPPRITAYRPDHVTPGQELDHLSEGFADAPDEVAAVLRRRPASPPGDRVRLR